MPAAENPQGLGFRLSRYVRLWVGGLSRRLSSIGIMEKKMETTIIGQLYNGVGFRVEGLGGEGLGFRVWGFKGLGFSYKTL